MIFPDFDDMKKKFLGLKKWTKLFKLFGIRFMDLHSVLKIPDPDNFVKTWVIMLPSQLQ